MFCEFIGKVPEKGVRLNNGTVYWLEFKTISADGALMVTIPGIFTSRYDSFSIFLKAWRII